LMDPLSSVGDADIVETQFGGVAALDLLVEQQAMDALRGLLETHTAKAAQLVLMAVDLRPYPPRMRRQQQDAIADDQRLLDGVRNRRPEAAHTGPHIPTP